MSDQAAARAAAARAAAAEAADLAQPAVQRVRVQPVRELCAALQHLDSGLHEARQHPTLPAALEASLSSFRAVGGSKPLLSSGGRRLRQGKARVDSDARTVVGSQPRLGGFVSTHSLPAGAKPWALGGPRTRTCSGCPAAPLHSVPTPRRLHICPQPIRPPVTAAQQLSAIVA